MEKGIILHKKYGLNPTMPICYICGDPTGEIVLLGAAYEEEAPIHMYMNKEPCPKCVEFTKQGIILIGVKENDLEYRTGQFIVLKDKAFEQIFGKIASRICFVTEEVLKKTGLIEFCKKQETGTAA